MKVEYEHKGHCISVVRNFSGTKLIIDGVVQDQKKDAIMAQLFNHELNGDVKNPDGTIDRFRAAICVGAVRDEVTLYCNDKMVESWITKM